MHYSIVIWVLVCIWGLPPKAFAENSQTSLSSDPTDQETLSLYGAYWNDNLSGDDFHSYGGIAWIQYQEFLLLAAGSAFTARELGWRYDLGQLRLRQSWKPRNTSWIQSQLRWGPDVIYKGKMVGQQIQNAFHGSTGVGETRLDYDEGRIAFGLGFEARTRIGGAVGLNIAGQGYAAADILPSRVLALSALDWTWQMGFGGSVALASGWRQVLHSEQHFSELDRNGPVFGGMGDIGLWHALGLHGGLMYRPVADYKANDRPTSLSGYAAQTWIALRWNTAAAEWSTLLGLW
jgi:hypothetical protein